VVEPRVSSALAAVLADRRQTLNASFAAARLEYPGLEGDRVLAFLAQTLARLAAVVPDHAAGPVIEGLFRVALPLIAKGLIGPAARIPLISSGWERLLPCRPEWLAAEPQRLARALGNALYHLGRQAGARPGDWIDMMATLGVAARSPDQWLDAGKLAAWRCGMAQYRSSALQLASALEATLAGIALGAGPGVDEPDRERMLARLRADPWAEACTLGTAPRRPRLVATIGGFRGLGGPFLVPPRVCEMNGRLLVDGGQASFQVHADRYGSAFVRTTVALGKDPEGPFRTWNRHREQVSLDADGRVTWSGQTASFPELAQAESAAFDGHTLAVAHPLSHHLFLVAPAVEAADGYRPG
jgi:hypothetical protein